MEGTLPETDWTKVPPLRMAEENVRELIRIGFLVAASQTIMRLASLFTIEKPNGKFRLIVNGVNGNEDLDMYYATRASMEDMTVMVIPGTEIEAEVITSFLHTIQNPIIPVGNAFFFPLEIHAVHAQQPPSRRLGNTVANPMANAHPGIPFLPRQGKRNAAGCRRPGPPRRRGG